MNSDFDIFNQPEPPYIILCNPDQTELYSLGLAYATKLTTRFNALSEFTFSFPKSIDGGITNITAYEYIQNKRLTLVEGYGYFQITNVQEDCDGSTPIKNVECKSLEAELIQKSVTAYGGTVPLYNIISPTGTLLDDMIQLAPTWTIGTIDASLLVKFRTFNVSDSNVYNFLMGDVSKAFECVFSFDTVNKVISAKAIATATIDTDIFLSYDNVISKSLFSEKSDEIVTCLSVYGGGNLNIRQVNPLGSDNIYDFSYYATTDWMSQSLIDAITAWEALVVLKQPEYSADLLLLQTYNEELLDLQTTLATLNEDYLVLEGVQKVRIQQGIAYGDITALMVAKQGEIASQDLLIANKQTQITNITADLTTINSDACFDCNFTPTQLLELNNFIYQTSYQNQNIIQTDTMTLSEIQDAAQDLYDQAKNVLDKVSQPRYEMSLESVNYIVLHDFEVFTLQTELGCVVTCELKDGTYIEAVLLELTQQFDDPTNFKLTFSNRLRLDNGNFKYSDLLGEVVKTGSAVAFDSLKWSNWENLYKNDVTAFINGSLDATTNNLISNTNQEIVINQNGLRARNFDGTSYSLKELWLVNNMIAFSDDGFLTSKLALGEITLPSGGTAFGLVGDVIIGRILAGNTLTIANDANNFILDEMGATLNNAKFTLQTTNTKILIDPTAINTFIIQKNEGGSFNNKFWVDSTGNVNFAGTLSGATGTFSGSVNASIGNIGSLVIDAYGLKTADGVNYLRGDGSLKWGGLYISGSSASFSGNIYANKLLGAVSYTQLTDIPADKITSGTMSGSRVYGGTIGFPGVSMGTYSNGRSYIEASSSIQLNVGSAGVVVAPGYVSISGNGTGYVGASGNYTQINGILQVNGYIGTTIHGYAVQTPYGTRYLYFQNGILYSYT